MCSFKVRIGDTAVIEDIDAHFTLMYVKENALPDLEAMLEGMEKRITAMAKSSVECSGKLRFNADFATEDYAWADLQVASEAHAALHGLVAAGLQRRPGPSRQAFFLKPAFHLSIRTDERTRILNA